MPNKDYYKTLGVKPAATAAEIKKAFRKLAKQNHPDAHPGDKRAEERFKEVSAAYDTLGDADKRKRYDQMREAASQGFGFDPKGFDFSKFARGGQTADKGSKFDDLFGMGGLGDVFSSLFDRGAGPGTAREERPRQGEDAVLDVHIPFELAISGGKHMVTVPLKRACSACKGSGAKPGTEPQTCLKCGGTGKVTLSQGAFGVSRPCPVCYGRGKIIASPCRSCGGAGLKTVQKKVRITVPTGVADGAKLRLNGQGHSGFSGGPKGDLILVVHVESDAQFTRKGNDIHSEVTIDLPKAVLGGMIDVPTTDGTVQMKVPPGVPNGSKLRLKGQGVKTKSGACGDQYVIVKVDMPKKLTEKQKQAFEKFAETMGY